MAAPTIPGWKPAPIMVTVRPATALNSATVPTRPPRSQIRSSTARARNRRHDGRLTTQRGSPAGPPCRVRQAEVGPGPASPGRYQPHAASRLATARTAPGGAAPPGRPPGPRTLLTQLVELQYRRAEVLGIIPADSRVRARLLLCQCPQLAATPVALDVGRSRERRPTTRTEVSTVLANTSEPVPGSEGPLNRPGLARPFQTPEVLTVERIRLADDEGHLFAKRAARTSPAPPSFRGTRRRTPLTTSCHDSPSWAKPLSFRVAPPPGRRRTGQPKPQTCASPRYLPLLLAFPASRYSPWSPVVGRPTGAGSPVAPPHLRRTTSQSLSVGGPKGMINSQGSDPRLLHGAREAGRQDGRDVAFEELVRVPPIDPHRNPVPERLQAVASESLPREGGTPRGPQHHVNP